MNDFLLSCGPDASTRQGPLDRSPDEIRSSDFDLLQAVRSRLLELRLQFRCDVTAQVHRRRVELRGEVDSTEHRVRVICIVSKVFGIHDVCDFISINPLSANDGQRLSTELHFR